MVNYRRLRNKLVKRERLRVLFLNDLGFQYGAGIAFLRQIQSFLLMGQEVEALCWCQGPIEGDIPFVPDDATGHWLGLTQLSYLDARQNLSQSRIIDNIVLEVKRKSPDIIIVGNLHGSKWSLKLLPALKKLDIMVIAFMHDCYLFTGRCAYTGNCSLYEKGCNSSCPTWDQYPTLPPNEIFDEWALRREIFCGSEGIPLVANSCWTQSMAQKALKGLCNVDHIYCGVDEQLFKKVDKALARRLLGIPQDSFVILGGAVNMEDYRKGGHMFKEVVAELGKEAYFLVFGSESQQLKEVHGTGFLRDYRKMPLVFSAADIFVGTSLEEAFGQTFCEAAACSLPIAAFNVGGVSEIARHNVNARLSNETNTKGLLREIKFLMANPTKCHDFGEAGRTIVEAEFTLKRQGENWMNYIENSVLATSGQLV
ncbi:glycosyltransferase [Leptolyngbya sp. FACHB-261]|uniref:glycosyltransferase n=1 Tax=Leptolyngbya sp. FACHB-261 TaxID=2692806 RepID=UPI00168238E2|nr:glycosyltransferase [Leptolyngbya sp. FACHB-261]MBD2103186.1 glycosyltransferase [Leptolyngbya sp. FACHB-261]